MSEDPKAPPTPPTPPPPPRGGRPDPRAPSMPPLRGLVAWLVVFALVMLTFQFFRTRQENLRQIPYSPDFVNLVKEGKLQSCEIVQDPAGPHIRGESAPEVDGGDPVAFRVSIISAEDAQTFLDQYGTSYDVRYPNSLLLNIGMSVLPTVLIFALLYFLFMRQIRSAGAGALSFGKSRARLLSRDDHKITFENVAGIDEAKEEVQEIIEFLKDPKRFQTLGGRIPKGVLLMGPPGTGKTLLAKAIAGEADVPFFSISGSDFVEMFVGVGASRVRDMFEQGKKNAPCLIFIDEIDAVGRSRFSGIGGGHDEREQTLNALLVEMDGFETQEGVIILAATNRPDVLDPALLRPGRFDRQIVIDLPTIDGREAILDMHAKKITLSKSADLRRLARGTPGFSGADLANLLNEAALLASRQGKQGVDLEDLEEARDKVKWGRERRSRVLDEKEKKITAYHESGHALVMAVVEESEPLHKITIIPRGVAYLGATMQLPVKDRYMEGKTKLLGILAGLMGGRVAEELVFTDITSGAASDLKEATRLARLMICNWGMSTELGPQTFGESHDMMFLGRDITRNRDYSEDTALKIDAEVHRMLYEAHEQAKQILTERRDKLEMVATLLIERETLDGRDVDEIVEHGRLLSAAERDEIDGPKDTDPEPPDNKDGQSDADVALS